MNLQESINIRRHADTNWRWRVRGCGSDARQEHCPALLRLCPARMCSWALRRPWTWRRGCPSAAPTQAESGDGQRLSPKLRRPACGRPGHRPQDPARRLNGSVAPQAAPVDPPAPQTPHPRGPFCMVCALIARLAEALLYLRFTMAAACGAGCPANQAGAAALESPPGVSRCCHLDAWMHCACACHVAYTFGRETDTEVSRCGGDKRAAQEAAPGGAARD